jgi:hypothetical protein
MYILQNNYSFKVYLYIAYIWFVHELYNTRIIENIIVIYVIIHTNGQQNQHMSFLC